MVVRLVGFGYAFLQAELPYHCSDRSEYVLDYSDRYNLIGYMDMEDIENSEVR